MADGHMRVPGQRGDRGRPGCGCSPSAASTTEEIATVLSDFDATERHITELYTKAVEQLGSDKAPVRFGGLYALERLAQDNPAHRQAIVNVICAYLRMPFSPTAPASKPEPEAAEGRKEPGTESETED